MAKATVLVASASREDDTGENIVVGWLGEVVILYTMLSLKMITFRTRG